MNMTRRRQLLLSAGAFLVYPLAGAQQPERVRRIGVIMGWSERDPQYQSNLAVFKEQLTALGWTEGRNLTIDVRWTGGDIARASAVAKELVALRPEMILSSTTPITAALQRETGTIPIVFVVVVDPVGSGFVKTLARPGANITGFIHHEASLVVKWLQLLKEIAPRVTRVTMFNPQTAPYAEHYLQPLKAAAPKIGVETRTAAVRSESEIEQVIAGLGREPSSGLVTMSDGFMTVHRTSIVALAARHKVPAVYYAGNFAEQGGLISYGVQSADLFRRVAPYVDRVLRGAKPADLPVQLPTKFELVINRKTAAALGLAVPQSMLLRADQVIE
jgi:putative tryptophan/tyrosine transport system substrate-binding protein